MAPADPRTTVPHVWTFTRAADGWVLAPFHRPWPVASLVRWVLQQDACGTSERAHEQLRQTLTSALRSPAVAGTRVTLSREANGLLMVESLDPSLLEDRAELARAPARRTDAPATVARCSNR